jgi:hypothetical protein
MTVVARGDRWKLKRNSTFLLIMLDQAKSFPPFDKQMVHDIGTNIAAVLNGRTCEPLSVADSSIAIAIHKLGIRMELGSTAAEKHMFVVFSSEEAADLSRQFLKASAH